LNDSARATATAERALKILEAASDPVFKTKLDAALAPLGVKI
jgi:hypothetical protein